MDSCRCLTRFPLERVNKVWPTVSQRIFLPLGSKAEVPLCTKSLTCSLEHRPVKATLIDAHSWSVMPLENTLSLSDVLVDSLVVVDLASNGVEYSNHGNTVCSKHTVMMSCLMDTECPVHVKP